MRVPRWTVWSAAAAPVLLIGGWQVAAARQPGGFDPVRQTISALAGHGATDRWIMTAGLAGVGACHLITALGLRPAAPAGRVLLAAGGAATVAVAAVPLPATGESPAHIVAASVAFPALSLWPALAWRRGTQPSRAATLAAASGLLALLAWFGLEFVTEGPRIGLTERLLAGAQSLWPLAAVLLARRPLIRSPDADRSTPGPDDEQPASGLRIGRHTSYRKGH